MYSVKAFVWKCQPMPYMIINLLSDVTLVALASVVVDFVVVDFAYLQCVRTTTMPSMHSMHS